MQFLLKNLAHFFICLSFFEINLCRPCALHEKLNNFFHHFLILWRIFAKNFGTNFGTKFWTFMLCTLQFCLNWTTFMIKVHNRLDVTFFVNRVKSNLYNFFSTLVNKKNSISIKNTTYITIHKDCLNIQSCHKSIIYDLWSKYFCKCS